MRQMAERWISDARRVDLGARVTAWADQAYNTVLGFHRNYRLFRWAELTLALGVCLVLMSTLAWSGDQGGQVTWIYQQAGQALQRGASPYQCATTYAHTHAPSDWRSIWMNCYVYPPFFGMLFIPVAALPLPVVAVAWQLLSLGCAVYVTAIIARIVVPRIGAYSPLEQAALGVLLLDLVLFFGPLRKGMRNGEADIVILALLFAQWQALAHRRSITSGVLMGLAIAIKPTAAILLGYYVWKREWKAALSASLTAAIVFLAPFALLPHSVFAEYLNISAYWTNAGFLLAPKSISLYGAVDRMLYLIPPLWSVFSNAGVAKAAQIGATLLVYAWATRLFVTRGKSAGDTFAFGLIILVLLLGSPLTEDAHMAIALLPLALIARAAFSAFAARAPGRWGAIGAVVVLYAFLLMPSAVLDRLLQAQQHNYSGLTGALVATYWFWCLLALVVAYVQSGKSWREHMDDSAAAADLSVAMR